MNRIFLTTAIQDLGINNNLTMLSSGIELKGDTIMCMVIVPSYKLRNRHI